MQSNSFRAALQTSKPLIGSWINSASPIVTEIMAGTGFDFLCVDVEHSAVDLPQTQAPFQAAVGPPMSKLAPRPHHEQPRAQTPPQLMPMHTKRRATYHLPTTPRLPLLFLGDARFSRADRPRRRDVYRVRYDQKVTNKRVTRVHVLSTPLAHHVF